MSGPPSADDETDIYERAVDTRHSTEIHYLERCENLERWEMEMNAARRIAGTRMRKGIRNERRNGNGEEKGTKKESYVEGV